MNIGLVIVMIIGGAAGILSTAYLLVSLPAVIIWKIFRSLRYKIKLTQ